MPRFGYPSWGVQFGCRQLPMIDLFLLSSPCVFVVQHFIGSSQKNITFLTSHQQDIMFYIDARFELDFYFVLIYDLDALIFFY